MYEFSRSLGDIVKKGRHQAGLTQKEVSIILDMDCRTLQNIETYKGNPSMEKLYPLIRLLKIDSQEIFYPDLISSSPTTKKLRLLLADCSDDEAEILIPVVLAVLSGLRKKGISPIPVKEIQSQLPE